MTGNNKSRHQSGVRFEQLSRGGGGGGGRRKWIWLHIKKADVWTASYVVLRDGAGCLLYLPSCSGLREMANPFLYLQFATSLSSLAREMIGLAWYQFPTSLSSLNDWAGLVHRSGCIEKSGHA